MKNIVVLTGAGISAESGLKTFRDANGLWEGHDVMEVASVEGFQKNPALVLNFYNKRRRQLLEVSPNEAHRALKDLESAFHVTIITQNVDDLHERAGSHNVVHLHGELLKMRSTGDPKYVQDCQKDIYMGNTCPKGHQLRPHIVWFGEMVPAMEKAVDITQRADILIIIGTSMQVYPAAGLMEFVPHGAPIYLIDPKPALRSNPGLNLTVLPKKAVACVPELVKKLVKEQI